MDKQPMSGLEYYMKGYLDDSPEKDDLIYNVLVKRIKKRWCVTQTIEWTERHLIAYYEVTLSENHCENHIINDIFDYQYIPRRSSKASIVGLGNTEEVIGFECIGQKVYHKYLEPKPRDTIWIDDKQYKILEVHDGDIIIDGLEQYVEVGKAEAEHLLSEVEEYEKECKKNDKSFLYKLFKKLLK